MSFRKINQQLDEVPKSAVWCGDLVDPSNQNSGWRVSDDLYKFCLYFDEVKLLHRQESLLRAHEAGRGDARVISELAESSVIVGAWPDGDEGQQIVRKAADSTLEWIENGGVATAGTDSVKVPISLEKLNGLEIEKDLCGAGVDAKYQVSFTRSRQWGVEPCLSVPTPVAEHLALGVGVAMAKRDGSEVVISDTHMADLVSLPSTRRKSEHLVSELVVGLLPVVRPKQGAPADVLLQIKSEYGKELIRLRRRLELEAEKLSDSFEGLSASEMEKELEIAHNEMVDDSLALARELRQRGLTVTMEEVGKTLLEDVVMGLALHGVLQPPEGLALVGLWSTAKLAFKAASRERSDLVLLARLHNAPEFAHLKFSDGGAGLT